VSEGFGVGVTGKCKIISPASETDGDGLPRCLTGLDIVRKESTICEVGAGECTVGAGAAAL